MKVLIKGVAINKYEVILFRSLYCCMTCPKQALVPMFVKVTKGHFATLGMHNAKLIKVT